MSVKLKKKLWPFFNRQHFDTRYRYVAKSLDGGFGWGVFDRLQDRFLEDKEVLKISQDTLMLDTITH